MPYSRIEVRTGLLLVGLFFSAVLLLTIPREIAVRLGPCLVALLAANASLVAAHESAGAERFVWWVLAATCGLGTLARIVFLLGELSGTLPAPESPVAYGMWELLSDAVIAGFGVAAFLKPHQSSGRPMRPPIIVDSFLLILLPLSLLFYFAAASRASASEWREMPGAAVALAMDLVAAGVLSAARRRTRSLRWKTAYVRLALAAACHGGSQAAAGYLLSRPAGVTLWWSNLNVLLEMLAFALLSLAPSRAVEPPAQPVFAGEPPIPIVWGELLVPALVLMGVVGAPLIGSHFLDSPALRVRNATLTVVMGIYVLLVLMRQILVQMANRDLALDLQRESLRLRLLLSNIQDAVITEDLDGRVVFANDRFLDMFAIARSQLKHLRFEDCIHADDRSLRWPVQDPLLGNALGPARVEFRGRRHDGAVLYLESTIAPVRSGGMVLGYQSVIRDITERRSAEKRQRDMAQRLEFLVSHMPLGCIVFDLDFRIIEWNQAAARIFGWTATEVFGRSGLEMLVPPDFWPMLNAAWAELQRSKSADHRLNCNLTKDRGVIEAEWFNTSLIDETGRVVAIASMVQDVTERKSLEAQLRQSQKMEAVGVLAGGVAHDFNNLLTVILGNLSLAVMRLEPGHPAARGLSDAEKAAERAAELVRQLLSFSRKGPSRPRPIDLNGVARETAELLRRTVDPRIQIQVVKDSNLWAVEADPGQMNQVLMNLCVNARDAMEEGGLLVISTANCHVDAAYRRAHPEARAGDFVQISVSDTGAGMDRLTLARIFEPFFTTKQPGKGTGLGLSMVYGIVKQHQGWVTVESEPGSGSRFSILLPRSRAVPQDESPQPAAPAAAGSETILVVDDEELIRNLGRSILESQGHRVIEASDGDEALQVLNRNLHDAREPRIQLVLLDMVMPRKSGRDTLVELQRIAPQVPVVLASGFAGDNPEDLAALGARTFIHKPYRSAELARVIREVLDSCEGLAPPSPAPPS